MTGTSDFIRMGLTQADRAVQDVIARDQLHLNPKTLPRARQRKANGRLKQIETILRRLILLMALALKLPPPAPRPSAQPADPPEGTDLATFPSGPSCRFALMPARTPFLMADTIPERAGRLLPISRDASTRRLISRILAVRKILRAPDAAALRLARIIDRLKARQEPRPLVGAASQAFRLGPELGAVSTALPGLINAALETWENSG